MIMEYVRNIKNEKKKSKKMVKGFCCSIYNLQNNWKKWQKTIKSLAWKFLRNCPFKFFIADFNLIIQYFYDFFMSF